MDYRAAPPVLTLALGLLLLYPTAACTPEEGHAPVERGLEGPNPGAVANLPPPVAPEAPARRPLGAGAEPASAPASSVSGRTAQDTEQAAEGPPRDLSAELNAALGQPTICTTGAPSAPTITVTVSTVVNEAGLVLRATASGGLTPEGLECMQARARAVRFRSPVPRAPINVVTHVVFRQTSAGTPATRTAIETPRELPPGAVDPLGGNHVPIAPRAGQAISPSTGQPVVAAPGTPVSNNQGVSIMGPSGTPIRR